MIQDHEKFRLLDENGKHDFFMEVNWKPDDPLTNECKILKCTFPDGKEAFIRRDYFNGLLFAIGRAEDQRQMIPQTIKKIHSKETVFGVKAKKDIQKGEMINFSAKVDFECPFYKQEAIGGVTKKSQFTIND